MKVAVASSDGNEISRHFGRSPYFIVYEIKNGTITGREKRANTFTGHARGECHNNTKQNENAPFNHAGHESIIAALRDCHGIICYGMGRRAAEDLRRNGINIYIVDRECTPDEAATLFIQGLLKSTETDFCKGHAH